MDIRRGVSFVGIEHISYWLPPTIIDNREVAILHDFGEDFVLKKLGIEERRVLDPEMSVSEMACNAISELLEETSASIDKIELLVVVSQTGDFSIPHTSALVQNQMCISETALVFDISLGCSGYVIGLDVAISLMERMGMNTGLLVTADAYSRIVDPSDRGTAPIFGDAATATLLSREPKWKMGKSDFGSRGLDFEKLIVRGSGSTRGSRAPLHMDGRAILNFTRKVVPTSVRKALELNGLSISEIDKFVFHQANLFVIKSLSQSLGLEDGQAVTSLSDIGNTTSSSIPIAFRREVLDREQACSTVAISGFGVGLSWSSSVLFRV